MRPPGSSLSLTSSPSPSPEDPVVWHPVDMETWLGVVEEHAGASELKSRNLVDYLGEVSSSLMASMLDWVRDRVSVEVFDALLVVLQWGLAALLTGLVVLLIYRWVVRYSRRPEEDPAVQPASSEPERPSLQTANHWRAVVSRRLAAGELRAALEALWWFAARSLDPRGLDAAWTTDEVLMAVPGGAPSRMRRALTRLDRCRYGRGLGAEGDQLETVSRLAEEIFDAVGAPAEGPS